jgi:hypothetical protein
MPAPMTIAVLLFNLCFLLDELYAACWEYRLDRGLFIVCETHGRGRKRPELDIMSQAPGFRCANLVLVLGGQACGVAIS